MRGYLVNHQTKLWGGIRADVYRNDPRTDQPTHTLSRFRTGDVGVAFDHFLPGIECRFDYVKQPYARTFGRSSPTCGPSATRINARGLRLA